MHSDKAVGLCLGPRPISKQFIRSVILLYQVHFPKFPTVNALVGPNPGLGLDKSPE